MVISLASRAFAFGFIGIFPGSVEKDNTFSNAMIYVLMNGPDMIIICVYIFLVWVFFNIFIYSHISLSFDTNILLDVDYKQVGRKANIILIVVIILYIISYGILFLFTIIQILYEEALPIFNSSFSLFSTLISIIYYLVLLFQYSGSPYINTDSKLQVRRLYFIILSWTFSRLISAVCGFVKPDFINYLIAELYSQDTSLSSFKNCLILAAYLIVTDIIPSLLIFNSDIMNITIEKDVLNKERLVSFYEDTNGKVNKSDEESLNSLTSNGISNSNDGKQTVDIIIKYNDFKIDKIIYAKTKSSFGSISEGIYNNVSVYIRTIEFERLSRYNLEELSMDLDEIIKLNSPYLIKVIGVCIEKAPILYILYSKQGDSLKNILSSSTNNSMKLTLKNKLNIVIRIGKGIKYLHSAGIGHLHLSSNNIIVDSNLNARITDFGFGKLKELASVFNKYKNKNSYSSPEILKLNSVISNSYKILLEKAKNSKEDKENYSVDDVESVFNSIIDGKTNKNSGCDDVIKYLYKADIYSYGLIIWEIFTEIKPFNISLKELYKFVVEENMRPELSLESIPLEIRNIIKKCWNKDINSRILIEEVLTEFDKINYD